MALGQVIDLETLQRLRERDAEVFRRRLQGDGERRIAEEMSLSFEDVSASLRRMSVSINPSFRGDLVRLELERLDAMAKPFFTAACAGDAPSAMVMLRIMERRSKYCGLDAPTAVASRVIVEAEQTGAGETPTSTDRMLAALERIVAEGRDRGETEQEETVEAVEPDGNGLSEAVGRDPADGQGWDTGEEASGRPGPFSGASAGQPRTEQVEEQVEEPGRAARKAAEADPRVREGWDSGRGPDGRPEGSAAGRRMRMAGEVIDPDREGPEPRGSITIFPPGVEDETMMQNGWEPPTEKLGADRATVSMAEPWRPGRNRAET